MATSILNTSDARRLEIIHQANERTFFVEVNGKKLKAQIAGAKLEFPSVWSGIYSAEISWALAKRIADGEVDTITI